MVVVLAVLLYNRLTRARNRTHAAWGDVDAELRRRADLVPELNAAVAAYAEHERSVLEPRRPRRATAAHGDDPAARAVAEQRLGGAIGGVVGIAEANPELRASERFAQLQEQLSQSEDRIALARMVYNDTVQTYNSAIEELPASLARRRVRLPPPRALRARGRPRVRRAAWLALALLAPARAARRRLRRQELHVSRAFVTVTLARSGEVLVREDLTFSYDGYFTGAYRDIPLAPDVQVERRRGRARARPPTTPGGNTTLGSSDAPGHFGAVRLPQGLRIVWHYQQDGGQRTFTLRYRLRGVVIAYDDAVEVAPQVWGDQWKSGLRQLLANVHAAGRRCPARAPGSSRRGSSTA